MAQNKIYTLPQLPYDYKDLQPYISKEQLMIHHQKHHVSYVNGANKIFSELEEAREENHDLDLGAKLKELSFHIGGHILHSLFWNNMAPKDKGGGGEPLGELLQFIKEEFGDFERFKKNLFYPP
jgi:Fe-Mn family superoxide dismutase